MAYSLINWENSPSTKTPINAENLKHMDEGIAQAHDEVDELSVYKANSIISKSSGTTVAITDSAKVKPKNIKLFGKGKQRQLEGNQLWDKSTSFLATGNQNLRNSIVVEPNTDYTVSLDYDVSGLYVYSDATYTTKIAQIYGSRTLTFNSGDNGIVYISDYQNVDSITHTVDSNVMVNVGTEALPWEPFVGNEPSPSINYPQKAEFLGESGSIGGKLGGENLIDVNGIVLRRWPEVVEDGIKITVDGERLIIEFLKWGNNLIIPLIKPVRSHARYFEFTFSDGITENRKWYMMNGTAAIGDAFYSGEGGGPQMSNLYVNDRIQIGCGDVNFEPGTTITFTRSYVNETINGFTPYIVTQPFTFQTPNGLRGIPLYGEIGEPGATYIDMLGNPFYADYKDFNGNVQAITEIVLTGTEYIKLRADAVVGSTSLFQITIDSTGKNFHDYLYNTAYMTRCILCNAYSPKRVWDKDEKGIHLFGGQIWIRGEFETADDFKSKLAELYANGTPVKVYAPLADPIITDTTEEEKAQLDKLVMNYPNTTIVNDAGAYMEVEYVCDTKKCIEQNYVSKEAYNEHENRIAELEKAIVNS